MLDVHSIETFGISDGPGIRLIVFLQGCHFRCLYCHNPDTQQIGTGKKMSVRHIMDLLKNQKPYFRGRGGLTVSGGEPLIQAKELVKLFRECKKEGINTCITTNGNFLDDDVKELLKMTDYILLDIKHIDDKKHAELTGASNKNPLKFAEYLEKKRKQFTVRHVYVPGFCDDDKYLKALGEHFKDYKYLEKLIILPYHTLGVYKYENLKIPYKLGGVNPPTAESLQKARQLLLKYLPNVTIQ